MFLQADRIYAVGLDEVAVSFHEVLLAGILIGLLVKTCGVDHGDLRRRVAHLALLRSMLIQ